MRPYIELDPYAKKRELQEYTVRSVYYDTPAFDCYDEKIEGLKVRKKFRIRGYNNQEKDSIAFLEIKRKYSNYIEKNRAPLLSRELGELFSTRKLDKHIISFSGNGKEKRDAQRFLYHYYGRGLRPTVLVIYEREAFVGKFDSTLRITFDKNLRSSAFPTLDMLYEEQQIKYGMTKYFILELKFNSGLPAWVQSIIKRYNLPRMALSKYTICLDSHKVVNKFYNKSQD